MGSRCIITAQAESECFFGRSECWFRKVVEGEMRNRNWLNDRDERRMVISEHAVELLDAYILFHSAFQHYPTPKLNRRFMA